MADEWYFYAGLFAVATAGLPYLRWRVSKRPAPEHSCCARCGYPTVGLPTTICPECGSDLQVVGTRRPSLWTRLTPQARRRTTLVAWSVWCVIAGLLGKEPFERYVQPGRTLTIELATRSSPAGAALLRLGRVWRMHLWPWQKSGALLRGTQPDSWFVELGEEPSPFTAFFILGADRWLANTATDGAAPSLSPPKGPAFMADLARGRLGVVDPLTEAFVEGNAQSWQPALEEWAARVEERYPQAGLRCQLLSLVGIIQAAPAGKLQTALPTGFVATAGGGWQRDDRYALGAIGVLILVWAAGVAMLRRSGRSRQS